MSDRELSVLELADWLGNEDTLIVTGAGISLASGLATFRGSDPDAVWEKDVTELGTARYFHEDTVGSWRWYLARFDKITEADPNPAHFAIARLEAARENISLVTQNIDCLHRRAGSKDPIEIHGRADHARCSKIGCENGAPSGTLKRPDATLKRFAQSHAEEDLPTCELCGSFLRPHVLWFDESYNDHEAYRFEEALARAFASRRILFAGTSFSVGITDIFLQIASRTGAGVASIDPAGLRPTKDIWVVREKAEVALPEVADALAPE